MTVSSRSTETFKIVATCFFCASVGGPSGQRGRIPVGDLLELLGRRAEIPGDQRDGRAFRRRMHAGADDGGEGEAQAVTTNRSIRP